MTLKDARLSPETQWDQEKNIVLGLDPQKLTVGSNKKAWWRCSNGHSSYRRISHAVGSGTCQYCAGRLAIPGETDLSTVAPEIASQWATGKNDALGLKLQNILPRSNLKVWWICSEGHEWEATVNSRSAGNGCPYCSGRLAVPGKTDLQTLHPDIAKQWSHNRNTNSPENTTIKSNKKVWWTCEKGHEWEAVVASRTAGYGCSYCSGREVLQGVNDLLSHHPDVSDFWSLENEKSPSEVTRRSGLQVELCCPKGHTWYPHVYSINYNSILCPTCGYRRTSRSEQRLYEMLRETYPDAVSGKKIETQFLHKKFLVADIFIPTKNPGFVVEYDGAYWHRDLLLLDTVKTQALLEDGYAVVRVREQTVGVYLPQLDVSHPRLLQVQTSYRKDLSEIGQAAKSILNWIETV